MDQKITFKNCSQRTMDLSLEDGRSLTCDILTIMRFDGNDYVVLMPQGTDEVFIYGFGQNEQGQPDLRIITEPEELEKVLYAFDLWYEQADDGRIPVDIFSGFLGAGKTTLIKKLLAETYAGEQVVLIENEFGVENIDAGFLGDSSIDIKELSAGCICCSMTGDFTAALQQVVAELNPDRIIIEPSGVGKLSDVIAAVEQADPENLVLDHALVVADASKCHLYMLNFGEFYNDQIAAAQGIILSRTANLSQERLSAVVKNLRKINDQAPMITTPWDQITGDDIFDAIEGLDPLDMEKELDTYIHHEHHEHHHHDGECCCGHEHHHHEGECCHEHHEHDHHEGECCHGHHEHDHHEGECCHDHHEHDHHEGECCHGHHEHHHHDGECCHGHHHAEDVFSSWGGETVRRFDREELEELLHQLDQEERFGQILRAKGIVAEKNGGWLHFDYVPGEVQVRTGAALSMGRVGVIGANIQEAALAELFRLN